MKAADYFSRGPGIRPLDGKTCHSHLWGVRGCDAGKLRSNVIDHVQVTVRPIVVAQAQIGAHRLGIGSVHLDETREGQEPVERVIALKGRQDHREIPIRQRKTKAIPGRRDRRGEFGGWTISSADAKLVEGSVVVTAETLKKTVREAFVLWGSVGELMTREVVNTNGDEDVLVDMKRRREPLRKHVHDVVIGIGPVVELGAEGVLPFLCGDVALRIRGVEDEAFELQFSDTSDLRPHFEREVAIRFVGIGPFNEPYFWIEVWPNLSPFHNSVQPVRSITQTGSNIAISARVAG